MNNNNLILGSIALFLLFDAIFISCIKSTYDNMLNEITCDNNKSVDYRAVILVYIFLIIGLVVFVLPNVTKENIFVNAFLYGIVLYGMYSFTNKAILNKWKYEVALLDTIWGGLLFYIVSYIYIRLKK
jgi:uncharacterized membrane protein